MRDEEYPPMPQHIVQAIVLHGAEPFYDSVSGTWVVGEDPGFDPDEDTLE